MTHNLLTLLMLGADVCRSSFSCRTWVNVWLAERSLALGAGRRPCLTTEGVIEDLVDWHKSPLKIKGDTAMVAHVNLRRLYWSCRSMFNRLSAKQPPPNQGLCREDLDFFLAKVEDELKAWFDSWNDAKTDMDRTHRLKRKYFFLLRSNLLR